MKFRNLEAVRYIVKEATGLDIMYAYEDLVFPEHGAFIIRFDDSNEKNLFCHFHSDCNTEDVTTLFKSLLEAARKDEFTIEKMNSYAMEQVGEEVEIRFH